VSDDFPIIPEKTALLFFDTLKGSPTPESAAAIRASGYIERLQKIERASRAAGIAIFYTQPEHRKDGRDWGNNAVVGGTQPRLNTYQGINFKGSRHAEILDEIAPQEGDYVISKHRWNAFHQTCLELSLRTAGIDTIMMAGGATHVGIASTAYGARDRDFSLIMLRDVIRGADDITEMFLDKVFPGMARVMTIDEAISRFAVGVPG
jgi:nicotinamidase-related amidase